MKYFQLIGMDFRKMVHDFAAFSAFIPILLATMALGATNIEAKSLYKSVREDGKIVYSEHLFEDARVEKKLEFKELPNSKIVAKERLSTAGTAIDLPEGDVVLYAAEWCGYCKKAKAYLGSKGISYREIDIDTDYGKGAFAQAGGQNIPLLFAKGERILGFSESAYDSIFNLH